MNVQYTCAHLAIDKWQRHKSVTKRSCVTFPACEGTWRAMNSTLTAMLGPGRTQHVHPCAATKTASPLTFVLQPPCTLTGCDTAGAGQHRLIRSAPSRPADVAVVQGACLGQRTPISGGGLISNRSD